MSLITEPVPYEEAARIVAEKQIMSKAAFDTLCDELKARAFTVAGLEDLRMVQEIRDAIAEIPMGAAWEDVKKQVADKLEQGGFSEKAADYRATLLLRHHGFAVYAQENYRELQEMKDAFPYWKYQTMGDEKVRSSHAALDGLILPADDPFWRDHFPPWEWNCRCQVVGVTKEEYDAAQTAGSGSFDPTDPDAKAAGWKLPPAALDRLHDGGQLDDGSGTPATVARTSSFHFDPSGPGLDMAEIEKRYNPADWARFKANMEAEKLADGRSVWDWANGVKGETGGAGGTPAGPAGETPAPPGQAGRTVAPRQDGDAGETAREPKMRVGEDPVCDAIGCRKDSPFSIEAAAARTNPRFSEGREFQNNCACCVQAYELARRGYAVEALPTNRTVWMGDEGFVRRETGRRAWMKHNLTRTQFLDAIQKEPDGARFIAEVRWPDGTGHAFNAEKIGGVVRFVNPQNPRRDARQYLDIGVKFGILRVDNLDVDPAVVPHFAKRG